MRAVNPLCVGVEDIRYFSGVELVVVTAVGLVAFEAVGLAAVVVVDVGVFKMFCGAVVMVAMGHKANTPEITHGTMDKIFFMLSLPYNFI